MKGGALFIGAIHQYLRTDRRSDEPAEWQGGRTAIVVDEAVLNTPEYSGVRRFIREHFFIKAVISLARDAFKYLAHTDAKTSILYLAKKPRSEVVQREPIFFAHAERVGYGATGNWVGDDLPQVLLYYRVFSSFIRGAYKGKYLDTEAVSDSVRELSGHGTAFYASAPPSDDSARIDFFDARFRQRHKELLERYGRVDFFGDLVKPALRKPPAASRNGEYDFAVVTRTGVVEFKGRTTVAYLPRDLWTIEPGTLVLSSIDLVKGAVAVAGEDVVDLVMSKEMFAYERRSGVEVDLHYLQLLLRSEAAKEMLLGFATGTSNRTRLESPEQLLSFPLPPLPNISEQKQIASRARLAYKLQRRAQERMRALLGDAQESWALPPAPPRTSTSSPVARARVIS
jgi:type I restriction enzyme M protein